MKITEQLKPGSELDRLVAEKMGYRWQTRTGGLGDQVGRWVDPENGDDAFPAWWSRATGLENPQYSTEIGAAWEVVDYVKERWDFDAQVGHAGVGGWYASFTLSGHDYKVFTAFADTAPLAICRAFLSIEEGESHAN